MLYLVALFILSCCSVSCCNIIRAVFLFCLLFLFALFALLAVRQMSACLLVMLFNCPAGVTQTYYNAAIKCIEWYRFLSATSGDCWVGVYVRVYIMYDINHAGRSVRTKVEKPKLQRKKTTPKGRMNLVLPELPPPRSCNFGATHKKPASK